jgi:hypothetical protein
MKARRVKVVEIENFRWQGRRALGAGDHTLNKIVIDPRQPSLSYLETMIHEHLHVYFPELSESRVEQACCGIARALWKKNYRRVMK